MAGTCVNRTVNITDFIFVRVEVYGAYIVQESGEGVSRAPLVREGMRKAKVACCDETEKETPDSADKVGSGLFLGFVTYSFDCFFVMLLKITKSSSINARGRNY